MSNTDAWQYFCLPEAAQANNARHARPFTLGLYVRFE